MTVMVLDMPTLIGIMGITIDHHSIIIKIYQDPPIGRIFTRREKATQEIQIKTWH